MLKILNLLNNCNQLKSTYKLYKILIDANPFFKVLAMFVYFTLILG